MKITPLDIRKQEFRRKFRGLDPDEVRNYLDQVAVELETEKGENASLQERLKQAEDRLSHYRLIEQRLVDATLVAQKALDETRRQSEKEAELIVREAQGRAQKEVAVLNEHISQLKGDISTLDMQRSHYFVRMRAMLRAQSDMLEAMEGDVPPVRGPGNV